MPRFVVGVVALVALGMGACAAGPRYYSGRVEQRRAEPEALLELPGVGESGYVRLGAVHATCRLRSGFRALADERLSDLDCSARRLGWVLRESAAAAGGEALAGLRCTDSKRGAERLIDCRADVARRSSGSDQRSPIAAPHTRPPELPAPSVRDVERIDEPDATLANRIRVDFSPRVRAFGASPRAARAVRELAWRPVWDVPLGDLRARCQGECPERALRHALLVAAGRLGAPDVVAVKCALLAGESECTGELAVPEAQR